MIRDENWVRAATDRAMVIIGAREHNLKNLSFEVPRNQLVVVTGVSGSGKSTLAFDLLFAEGQRRFLDSMSAYARQFVEQLPRPDVDLIAGIPPTVSIEQRNARGGGKSTVATVTEIHHFLRLLFARTGVPYCPDCQRPVRSQTREEVMRQLRAGLRERGDLLLLSPLVRGRKGFHSEVAVWAADRGYTEIRADGKMYATNKPFRLDRFREHSIEVSVGVLGRGGAAPGTPDGQALVDRALEVGHGTLYALDNHRQITVHSTERACPECHRSFDLLDPKHFSYHSPQGWCPKCRGFGELFYLPDVDRGARAEAIEESWYEWQEGQRELCPDCGGLRLNRMALAVRLEAGGGPGSKRTSAGLTLGGISKLSVSDAARTFRGLKLTGTARLIARDILPEIRERLRFLDRVGLGYLELGRGVPTLSGGEAQRIRLAAQLGSNLSGVLYILDEPSIGLHPRDNERLLETLIALRDRGNSLLVVEHDESTMLRADHIIDLGPGAGVRGGEVVAAGTLDELLAHPESVTGRCLREHRRFPTRGERRFVAGDMPRRSKDASGRGGAAAAAGRGEPNQWLVLADAEKHNLKKIELRIPLGRFTVVTGVSGSGKSTLVRECLLPALLGVLAKRGGKRGGSGPGTGRIVEGAEGVQAVHEVDQAPIGRTPRSTPATYVGFLDEIRKLFAGIPEARLRGYGPGRFSFNSAQGRCPACEGAGILKIEMNFLPPAYTRCETCEGTRFNPETLDVRLGGKNIAEVLDLSVEEARDFFAAQQRIRRPLDALHDTGLDYLKLGQTSPTLSGGEAQRVKLVTHLLTGLKEGPDRLVRRGRSGSNLFILEEPTIGLHMADVRRLVEMLQRLVDAGHTVVVIEHNLELIAEADWVIDLGPEAGEAGGQVVVAGTPEQVGADRGSITGRFLRKVLSSRAPIEGHGGRATA